MFSTTIFMFKKMIILIKTVSKLMPKMDKFWTFDRQYGTNKRQFC